MSVSKAIVQPSVFDPMLAFREVLKAADEWVRVHEEEATKRTAILAARDVTLAEIHAKRELFMSYLERSFDERREMFAGLFARLDVAMAQGSGDVEAILGAINELAAKSPFADLRDISMVKSALVDPDHEWVV